MRASAAYSDDRIESVQILRGLAASSVAMFHFAVFLKAFPVFGTAFHYGYLGIAVFFVISGFVIPHAMQQANYSLRSDGLDFFLRRLVRLEPAYLASIALICLVGYAAAHTPGYRGAPFVIDPATLLLHLGYLVPWFGKQWLNPVFWTLAIEFQYYLAMIFAAPLLIGPSAWRRTVFLGGALLLSFVSDDTRLLTYHLPFFGLGFVTFLRFHYRLSNVAFAAWLVCFAASWIWQHDVAGMIAGLATVALIFVPVTRPVPVLTFLGTISYSLYLVHYLVVTKIFNLFSRLPDLRWLQFAALIVSILITLALAWLLWYFVERPSAAKAKQMGRKATRSAISGNAASSAPHVAEAVPKQ